VSDWKSMVSDAVKDFQTVADLARCPLGSNDFQIEYLESPHKPPSRLPLGKMAVYGFWHEGEWMKIGLAGPNSSARYTSQHYNQNSAQSTLAGSLCRDPRVAICKGFDISAPGNWIKTRCHRVNILLDSRYGPLVLAMLEAFLHLRLRPRYER
jgi:hypothetical protein